MQRGLHCHVAPAERVHAEARQEVEVAGAAVVVEVTALAPYVVAVETEGPERPCELLVHIALVQGEVLPGSFRECAGYIKGHAAPCTALLLCRYCCVRLTTGCRSRASREPVTGG